MAQPKKKWHFPKFKKNKTTYMLMGGLVIAAIAGIFFFTNTPVAKLITQNEPEVQVSFDRLSQADTLLVVVKNEPGQVNGTLGLVALRFFRNETQKDWVALVGIPVDKKPGNYTLVVNNVTNQLLKKGITVTKRHFPITPLVISAALSQQGYTPKKIVTTIVNKENKTLSQILNIVTANSYITKSFIYPLSEVKTVGEFGDIRAAKPYQIQHLGVDLKAPVGTDVYAVNNGKIVFEKNMPDYGNMIIIDHGLGMYSLYLHLSAFKIKTGQMVKQGDTIALSGATGYAIGPHLHFSIKIRGAALDPLAFIKTTQTDW